MKTIRLVLCLIIPAFALLLACTGLQQLVRTPSVSIANVGLQSLSFDAVTLDFDLKVHNPNAFGVSLLGFSYKFLLEDKELFSGNNTSSFAVPAQGDGHAHIPITLNFNEIYRLAQNTKSLDSLKYHISGSLNPGGLLAGMSIPFSKTGTMPNLRIPEVSLGSLTVNKLDLSGIDLNLALKMKNPNAFAFDIGKLNYAVKLARQLVASGVSQNMVSVPQKGSGEIILPIKIDFAGAAASLKNALTGGVIDCAISGGAGLNTPFGLLNLPLETAQKVTIFK
ncbi:MAG TPA: LEA type 2 family protein [bacterium]|nr:LEA type 2 family protein [bacterium]HQG46013.1 LEA type 2 family protein [bacterium]HQI47549.1 LEA type 2 family protein [bacterium]HQJ63325.1 LEA type 2 family protein [bacterium]